MLKLVLQNLWLQVAVPDISARRNICGQGATDLGSNFSTEVSPIMVLNDIIIDAVQHDGIPGVKE